MVKIHGTNRAHEAASDLYCVCLIVDKNNDGKMHTLCMKKQRGEV